MPQIIIKLSEPPRLDRLYKMPGELLQDVGLDFANKLLVGETITAIETDDIGTGVVLATAYAGTIVTLDLGGGSNGEQIPITITATGSLGSVRQAVLLVQIRDPREQVAPVIIAPSALNWRGDYAPIAVYRQHDLVRDDLGSFWLATRISSGVAPALGADWTAFGGAASGLASPGDATTIGLGADYPTVNAAVAAGKRDLLLLPGIHYLTSDILLDPHVEQALPALHIIGGGGQSQTTLDFGPYEIKYADPSPIVFPGNWLYSVVGDVWTRNSFTLLLGESVVDFSAWGTSDGSGIDLTTLGITADHYFTPGYSYGSAPLRIASVEPKRIILAEKCFQQDYIGFDTFGLDRAVNNVRFEQITLRKMAIPVLIESEDGMNFVPRFFGQFDGEWSGWSRYFFNTDYSAIANYWQFFDCRFDYSHDWNYDATGWSWTIGRCTLPLSVGRVTLPRSNPELQELYGDHVWGRDNAPMYLPPGSSVQGSFIGLRNIDNYALTTWAECIIMAQSARFGAVGNRAIDCTFPLATSYFLGPQALMLGCRFYSFDSTIHGSGVEPTARISASYDKNGVDLSPPLGVSHDNLPGLNVGEFQHVSAMQKAAMDHAIFPSDANPFVTQAELYAPTAHPDLLYRDLINQHPIAAITGLAPVMALLAQTAGNNIAFGIDALVSNTTGFENIAIGEKALKSNVDGALNIAIGLQALENNISGYSNTAIGEAALRNATGDDNTAVGSGSGGSTTGYQNTSVGTYSGGAIRTGYRNTSIGMQALSSGGDRINATAVGARAQVTGDNQVQLGDALTTTYAYGAVQDRSDIRDKTDIRDTQLGLAFIEQLRPVDFKWDMRDDYRPEPPARPALGTPNASASEEEITAYEEEQVAYKAAFVTWQETSKLSNLTHNGSKARSRFHHGLIAQEVREVIMASGVDFGGFQDHQISGGDDVLSIGYGELIAPMIKAIQELSARLAALE